MSALIQVEDNGEIRLPAQIHGWTPLTQVRAVRDGQTLTLDKVQTPSSNELNGTCSPAERASKFRQLIATLRGREGAEIPDKALRRENL